MENADLQCRIVNLHLVIIFHNASILLIFSFNPVNVFVLCISGYDVQNNIEYIDGIINLHQILTDSNEISI